MTIIHVAAPLTEDEKQHCARCGVVLKDFTVSEPHSEFKPRVGGSCYPTGALIARGPNWQAMELRHEREVGKLPNTQFCTPSTPSAPA